MKEMKTYLKNKNKINLSKCIKINNSAILLGRTPCAMHQRLRRYTYKLYMLLIYE